MPDMLGARSEMERTQIAEALTHFLVAQSKGVFHTTAAGRVSGSKARSCFIRWAAWRVTVRRNFLTSLSSDENATTRTTKMRIRNSRRESRSNRTPFRSGMSLANTA